MNGKIFMGPLFLSILLLVSTMLTIGTFRSGPGNVEGSKVVFFVS